jgi:hypothetical protein
MGGLASIGPDGKSTRYIFMPSIQSGVRFGMGGKVWISQGQDPATIPSTPQRWIELALRDEAVARALTYYARHLNPTSLYKVFETIRMDIGGEGQIVKRAGHRGIGSATFGRRCKVKETMPDMRKVPVLLLPRRCRNPNAPSLFATCYIVGSRTNSRPK